MKALDKMGKITRFSTIRESLAKTPASKRQISTSEIIKNWLLKLRGGGMISPPMLNLNNNYNDEVRSVSSSQSRHVKMIQL